MGYYEILGVSKDTSPEDIKKAFLALALLHHPDRNKGKEKDACKKFKEITVAFDVLNNPEKKSQYDRDGYVGRRPPNYRPRPKTKPKPPPPPPQPSPTSNDPHIITKENLKRVECTFVENSGMGRTIVAHLHLRDDQRKEGGSFYVRIKRRITCMKCVGDGCYDERCPYCVLDKIRNFGCGQCNGEGVITRTCTACNGEGVNAWEITDVRMKVPENAQIGQTILVQGEGESAPRKPPGNLKVIILP